MALFKAQVINDYVRKHDIQSAIEFGCGDGNQLSLLQVPSYVGLDISPTAIESCATRFAADRSKSFFLYDPRAFVDCQRLLSAELTLSLDVIYHLVEDDVYERYLGHLFGAAQRSVIIYSSNEDRGRPVAHVRHRRFTDGVAESFPAWTLVAKTDNRYPFDPRRPTETSFADFYVFEK